MKQTLVKTTYLFFIFSMMFIGCKSKKDGRNMDEQRPPKTNERGDRGRERPSVAELFLKMDENKDQKLSKTEVKGRLSEDFSSIDTNKNGFLSKEEVENGAKRGPKR